MKRRKFFQSLGIILGTLALPWPRREPRRQAQVLDLVEGKLIWVTTAWSDLKKRDWVRFLEPDGTPVNNGEMYFAQSDAYLHSFNGKPVWGIDTMSAEDWRRDQTSKVAEMVRAGCQTKTVT